jgi:bifunctional non-homologous end joining protein LigD
MGISNAPIQTLETYRESGSVLYDEVRKLGMEGIVGKDRSSTYQAGKRSSHWIKVKGYHSEEFLVCGFTAGQGARSSTFGALVLGQLNPDGALEYAGNVGGGFSDEQLSAIRKSLDNLKSKKSPFAAEVEIPGKPTWVRPEIVIEVRFMSRTAERHLRFPIFLRLRPDVEQQQAIKVNGEERAEMSSLIEQLESEKEEIYLEVEGHEIHCTHLSKVLWPAKDGLPAFSKRDLIRYFMSVSDLLLPHLKDRPLSFVRYPDGIANPGFFQKHPLPGTPEFVRRERIWTDHNGKALEWLMCDDLATLIWFAQMSTIEIHPWYSRVTAIDGQAAHFDTEQGLDESPLNYPDFVVFDLDPNIKGSAKDKGSDRAFDKEAWRRTVEVAHWLKKMLDGINAKPFVKTSGKTGLHVFLPIERTLTYDVVRQAAETIGRQLESHHPQDVTMVWSVKKRPEAVFFDHNQNVRGKTLAAPFSPRATYGAPVSFPVPWEKLDDVCPPDFNLQTVPGKDNLRDAWSGILESPMPLVSP